MTDPYNDGYTHEAMHTVHVAMTMFGEHVMDTRCAAEFHDVAVAADNVEKALYDLYQLIGTKMTCDVLHMLPTTTIREGFERRRGLATPEADHH